MVRLRLMNLSVLRHDQAGGGPAAGPAGGPFFLLRQKEGNQEKGDRETAALQVPKSRSQSGGRPQTRFPCRAQIRLQANPVTQADRMRSETPAAPQTVRPSDPLPDSDFWQLSQCGVLQKPLQLQLQYRVVEGRRVQCPTVMHRMHHLRLMKLSVLRYDQAGGTPGLVVAKRTTHKLPTIATRMNVRLRNPPTNRADEES